MKSRLILALGASLMSLYTQAQRPNMNNMPADGTLKARIIDVDTDEPIEYASFALFKMKDSSVVSGSIANTDGEISIEKLSYGAYYAEVDFIGYKKNTIGKIMITPRSKNINLGDVKLIQAAVKMDEVEVMAERKHIEYKVDRKVINVNKDLVAASGTAVDVLENTPSITTDLDGNVSLRGSSNFQVLIDGKPSVLDGNEILQQLPVSTIKQIEVITNPSAKYDPDGVSGIINIVMKEQKMSGLSGIINASVGSFGNYSTDLLLNYRVGKFNFFTGFETGTRGRPGYMTMNRESYFPDTTYYMDVDMERSRQREGYNVKAGFDFDMNKNNSLSF